MECSVEGCADQANVPGSARGLCRKHYRRWQRHGNTDTVLPHWSSLPPIKDRFWSKVKMGPPPESGPDVSACWLWLGAKTQYGHGYLREKGKQIKAHRFAYELLVGPLAADMQVHHLCNNPGCVNPDHLQPLTWNEHIDTFRMHNEHKTHCKRGHPLSGDNLYVHPSGKRQCRECGRMLSRRHYQKKTGGMPPA